MPGSKNEEKLINIRERINYESAINTRFNYGRHSNCFSSVWLDML